MQGVWQRFGMGKRGDEIYNPYGVELVDFGEFRLPPRQSVTDSGILFSASVYSSAGGFFNVDAFQLMPARDFLALYLRPQAADGDSIVWDGRSGNGYFLEADGDTYSLLEYRGGGLHVHPGRTNKLMVTFADNGGQYNSTKTADVTVKYRPRRLTV